MRPWAEGEVTALAAVLLLIAPGAPHRGQSATSLRVPGIPNAKPYGA